MDPRNKHGCEARYCRAFVLVKAERERIAAMLRVLADAEKAATPPAGGHAASVEKHTYARRLLLSVAVIIEANES